MQIATQSPSRWFLFLTEAENFLAQAHAGYGRLQEQQGNKEKARKRLTDALKILERLGTLIEPDKVREELPELAQ
jgi:hypothetical protein